MSSDRADNAQLELARQLQTLLLKDFLSLAASGELSPTDRRTLYQMLKDGGWSLDPTRLPQDLRSKLTSALSPTADLDDDPV
jgi:hypothetical protein